MDAEEFTVQLAADHLPDPLPPAREADPFSAFAPETRPAGVVTNAEGKGRPLSRRGVFTRRAAIALLAVLAVTLAAIVAVREVRARTTSAPVMTRLSVTSMPAGAEVLVDGTRKGVTPIALDIAAGSHRVLVRTAEASREMAIAARPNVEIAHHIDLAPPPPATGELSISSTPPGLSILIDGLQKGVTPARIAVSPGTHKLTLSGRGFKEERAVKIEAGATATVVVSAPAVTAPAPGSLVFTSPIDVQLFEGDTLIGSSRTARLMLPAGSHTLTAVNDALGFRKSLTADVRPGSTTTVALAVPNGSLSVNAKPWAEVWLDGKPLGDTPIGNFSTSIGQHELVLRHPQFGEHRQTVIVGASRPTRIGVDLNK
jgi:serine/threonine-protein kinase